MVLRRKAVSFLAVATLLAAGEMRYRCVSYFPLLWGSRVKLKNLRVVFV